METSLKTHSKCLGVIRPVRDALEILQGKWKLNIIVSLMFDKKRFTQIAKDIPGITDKMLAKELKSLEENQLIERIQNEENGVIEYIMTPHGKSLSILIDGLRDWGTLHREQIFQASSTLPKVYNKALSPPSCFLPD